MSRTLTALLVCFLLFACGGDEASAPQPASPDADGAGGASVKPLSVDGVTPVQAPEAVAPPTAEEAEARFFAKVNLKMKSLDVEERAKAVELLRAAKDQAEAGRRLTVLLMDEDEDVRFLAAGALVGVQYKAGVGALRTLIAMEESAFVKKEAYQSLFALAGKSALPDGLRALEDDEGGVRAVAVAFLAGTKSNSAVAPLIKCLTEDFNETVRAAAAQGLREMGAKKAAKALGDALEDRGLAVRAEAAKALGEVGNKASVEPLIMLLLDEEDSQVLVPAMRSLEKLTGEKFPFGDADVEEQDAALKAWQDWWEENQEDY